VSLRCNCRAGSGAGRGIGRLRTGDADEVIIEIWALRASLDTDSPIDKASGDVEGGPVKIHRS